MIVYPINIYFSSTINSTEDGLHGVLVNLLCFTKHCYKRSNRFHYMHYDKKHGPIHKSIEALDHMGMDIIETGDPDAFKEYLQDFGNTICGRHPISVFLHMLRSCSEKIGIGFIRYEQSSKCKSMKDSSVSYASATAKRDGGNS